jgi:superfamily II DNA or RNA helicase
MKDILNRNLKKKYLLPQSFIDLFDNHIVIDPDKITETKTYKYIDKVSQSIKNILELDEDIYTLQKLLKNNDKLPNHFWNMVKNLKNDNVKKDVYIPRPNYLEFIKNLQKQNFKSGITIQATGTGKSFQIFKTIDIYQKKYRDNKNDYLIIAPKLDILRDLFYKDGELDKDKFDKLKRSDIINIYDYNIVDLVTKDFDKLMFSKIKPNIIIANMQYLIFMADKNVEILKKNLKISIFDECHNVSGEEIFKFIDNLGEIINIGFSATPLRNTSDKLLKKIFKIYGSVEDKKINVISSYDIFDGISDGVILPFKHYFFEFKSCYKNDDTDDTDNLSINEDNLDYNKNIVKSIIFKKIVSKLPYKKIVCWCRTKKLARAWKLWFTENFNNFTTYLSISGNDDEDTYLDFKNMIPKDNDINAILICVGRCREGSDIQYVDCGIYLDPVKNRSIVVSMQTAGRIMRTDHLEKKSHAFIVEGYLPLDCCKTTLAIDLIIGYYMKLLQISEDKNDYTDKLKYLLDNTNYDEEMKLVKIKVDDIDDHDCILDVNMKIHNWKNVHKAIEKYAHTKINNKNNAHLNDNENIKLIKDNDFTFSKINKAFIDNKDIKITSYLQLIKYLYIKINNIDKIMKDTQIRIVKEKKEDQGYKYFEDFDISIQGVNAKQAILEIVRQCMINNISFDIEIELKKKDVIKLDG